MDYDRGRELLVHCPHCQEPFPAPKSMIGGHANCPRCRRAVPVGGGYEPLFWVLFGLGAAFVLGISALLGIFVHPAAGITAFVIGAVILGIIVVAS